MTKSAVDRYQKWSRLGRLFDPHKSCPDGFSHGANPVLSSFHGTVCQIFFTSRDSNGNSHIFRAQFDLQNPVESFRAESEPALSPGRPGHFDDAGAMATSVFTDDSGKNWLLYVGWNLASAVPFRNALGLAEIVSQKKIRRFSQGPLLDRSIYDPCFIASACAAKVKGDYVLYYTSGEDWIGELQPRYRLKIARSNDFINWQRSGDIAIDYAEQRENCITSPCVIQEGDKFRMWFSCRGEQYRIGYAESADGICWQRLDRLVLLEPSEQGWDDQAVCYPNVFSVEGKLYMLYNGNGYGASGFGLAVLE